SQTPVPEPIGLPRNIPLSIGPPESPMVGRSQLAAPINKDGVVLSHPMSKTTPSIGLPRMDSSTSMAARLRNSIAVGRSCVSPSDMTGNSRGKPPRSEEHTSELQSRENLVCRLLLEKKNKTASACRLVSR